MNGLSTNERGRRRSSARRSGFTLIEIIISTALFALLLTGAYYCLRAGIATQQTVDAREEMLQNGRVALALITADLRGACVLSEDAEFVGLERNLGAARADNLDFATHNYTPRHPGEGDWCEVSYFLDRDRETGRLSLWRRRDATRDYEPFSGGMREEIAQNVQGLRFEYYDGFDWYDAWGDPEARTAIQASWKERPNVSGLPEAVRVTVWFEPTPRGRESSAESTEPPLVLQAVARINLAAAAQRTISTGSATNTSSNALGPATGGQTP